MTKEELKNKYSAFITEISEILGLGRPVDILKLCAITDLFFKPLEKRIEELEQEKQGLKDYCDKYVKTILSLRKLEEENAKLKAQIEKMKCCGNCIHCYEGAYHNGYRCKDHARESVCDNWEMMTDEVRKEMLEDDM